MLNHTPSQIVSELDRYIVRQDDAKRAVAIALRNRWRRQQVSDHMRDEIVPNNIIMIGPTGVGKTEIARRIAKLTNAPFVKVEATNYTEVGYMGRDVESIIRDLTEISVSMVTQEFKKNVREKAEILAEERILSLLMPDPPSVNDDEAIERRERTREKLREKLRAGELEEKKVTIKVKAPVPPIMEIFSKSGLEDFNVSLPNMPGLMGGANRSPKEREATIKDARTVFLDEESEKLLDLEKVHDEAKHRVETQGMVFVDEIDKIAMRSSSTSGPDVSREGVQRDLLPIVEGAAVNTRYGVVRTDHILFIAAGAFNVSKPSDLIPEFQGRFPIRVELASLTQEDFERILREPDASLPKQYQAMLATEGCKVTFTDSAIKEIARVATVANERSENIGARRLQTVMARLLEDLLFVLPEAAHDTVVIDAEEVSRTLDSVLADEDLTRYIL